MGLCTSSQQEMESMTSALEFRVFLWWLWASRIWCKWQCMCASSEPRPPEDLCSFVLSGISAFCERFLTTLLEEKRPHGPEPGYPTWGPSTWASSLADLPADCRAMSEASSDRQSYPTKNTDLEQIYISLAGCHWTALVMLHIYCNKK